MPYGLTTKAKPQSHPRTPHDEAAPTAPATPADERTSLLAWAHRHGLIDQAPTEVQLAYERNVRLALAAGRAPRLATAGRHGRGWALALLAAEEHAAAHRTDPGTGNASQQAQSGSQQPQTRSAPGGFEGASDARAGGAGGGGARERILQA